MADEQKQRIPFPPQGFWLWRRWMAFMAFFQCCARAWHTDGTMDPWEWAFYGFVILLWMGPALAEDLVKIVVNRVK